MNKKFCEIVREARVNKMWTQKDLTENIQKRYGTTLSPHFISKVERGMIPDPNAIFWFAEILGIELDILFKKANEEKEASYLRDINKKYNI